MEALDFGNDFLAHRPIPGVRFEHNDYVRVVAGQFSGNAGSLVGIHTMGADPAFVLEAESGRDLVVLQSEVSRVAV
jgi:hypothetical protein